jgi:hypothetical protein
MAGKTAYLLGAGFSRSLCEKMPLLNDLTQLTRTELKPRLKRLKLHRNPADFEQLITYLATAYPWKSVQEVLEHRGLYFRIVRYLVTKLKEIETEFFETPDAIERLNQAQQKLLMHWFRGSANIITLNYDTLLDLLFLQLGQKYPPTDKQPQRVQTLLDLYRLPIVSLNMRSGTVFMDSLPITESGPQLVKLHGSANWYGSEGIDLSAEPVYYLTRYFEPSNHQAYLQRGLKPYIVPPTFEKNSVIGQSSFQAALWTAARHALEDVEELVVIGYSFPVSDTYLQLLFYTTLRRPVKVTVIDIRTLEDFDGRITEFFRPIAQVSLPQETLTLDQYVAGLPEV